MSKNIPEATDSQSDVHTLVEIATSFRCGREKVAKTARENGIGAQLGGRAGWRVTDADKQALWNAMKPAPPQPTIRRRRRAS